MKDKSKFYDETVEVKPMETDTVMLVFKEGRSFDLHVDREMYHFNGREEKIVPRSVIVSPDFNDQIKELFLIKEA